jgi:hypothetical protein
MENMAQASEEVFWSVGFAFVAAALAFALLAGTTWVATMLGTWAGTF